MACLPDFHRPSARRIRCPRKEQEAERHSQASRLKHLKCFAPRCSHALLARGVSMWGPNGGQQVPAGGPWIPREFPAHRHTGLPVATEVTKGTAINRDMIVQSVSQAPYSLYS